MKELEDHAWFPSLFRNFQTDFTGFVAVRSGAYAGFIRHLRNFSSGRSKMTDLCSGSGEPAISIFRECGRYKQLELTDLFPRRVQVDDERIIYNSLPNDALKMKFKTDTVYTMYNALHHFTDEQKQLLVQKIKSAGAAAFFAEPLQPTFFCFVKIFFLTTIGCVLVTPFIRPFSFKRLFFTYILPVNILTISIDGLVSVVKSRSEKQYRVLFADYREVKISRLKNRAGSLLVIQVNPST